MIPIQEAACPKCFNKTDVAYPLTFDNSSKVYSCTKVNEHKYIEDNNGFLASKK